MTMVVRPSRLLAAAAGTALAAGLFVPATTAAAAPTPRYVADPASLVNPIIGTSGAVDDFPGADTPFGMVQWSPDTPSRPAGGGYEYNDNAVTGFSLTHVSGPGCAASGDFPILPVAGAVPARPDATTLPLDHQAETARAGYYKLTAAGITTELSATTRTGAARFSFPQGSNGNLILKLSDSAAGSSGTRFQVINNHEIQGQVTSGNFCGATDKYTAYFDMTFDQPITGYGTYQNSSVAAGNAQSTVNATVAPKVKPGSTQPKSSNGVSRPRPDVSGKNTATAKSPQAKPNLEPPTLNSDGAYVSFDTAANRVVQANVGLSYVSNANAKQNRLRENPRFAIDSVAKAAHASWNKLLGKIQIGGGDTSAHTTFYTALYHALLHPNVFSDVNGQFAGFDGQVHQVAKGHVEYANYSGWDIYRSQAQLAAMVAPQQTSDSIRSMLNQYDEIGQLPKWALNNGESYVMVGDPADAIIADAYAFGARDFDTHKALSAMLAEANQPNNVRPGITQYLNQGYLPVDGSYGCCNFYGSVSTQQEYNTADYAISSFASALGNTGVANTFASRANNWQNVFNPATNYLQAKTSKGAFAPGFSPTTSNGFVEGSSAQYTPMEPFDIAGLIAAAGGKANWIAKLNSLSANITHPTAANADFGNEPSIEIPWEYDYAGAPYLTQSTVRSIQKQIFTNAPAGIAGNDDLGTMSAWYVWSALGFYPETPGTADLALGSPLFAKAAIHLPSGKTLRVSAPNASAGTPYVHSMTVNGSSWSHAYLPPAVTQRGSAITVDLSATPNKAWAAAPADAPPSNGTGLASALGWSSASVVVAAPGGSATLKLGARNLSAAKQTVSWQAQPSTGLSVGPTAGTLMLPKSGDGSQTVSITVPSTEGRYYQSFSFRDAVGNPLPSVTVEIDAAKPGELWPYYNNTGVAQDGKPFSASFDGDGYSYSASQMTAAGIGPNAVIKADGLSYTWPDQPFGTPDNIEAGGQVVPLAATPGVTKIGILGSATNASPGSDGDFTVTYTDGSTSTVHLGMTDWTLGGGSQSAPVYGNTVAVTTNYRDTSSGGRDTVKAYLFSAVGQLTAGKTVASVTLPSNVGGGQLHVFAFATG
ncbi:MAG TPA: lectin [Jatrophihabitans sp.]|nr:lectin [Jatrophihabitans sp.]